jgi:hypothetical protein
MPDRAQPRRVSRLDERLHDVDLQRRQLQPGGRTVVDDDLQIVDPLRETRLDERPGPAGIADRVERVVAAERRAGRAVEGIEELAGVPARGCRERAGGADVGDVVALGRQPPLPGEVRRQAEHVELGRHPERERLREAAVHGMGVGVDQAGQQCLPGAVHDDVGRAAVRLGDPVAVDEHIRAPGGALTVEDADGTDKGAHWFSSRVLVRTRGRPGWRA